MAVTTKWNKQGLNPSSSWSEKLDVVTSSWSKKTIVPSSGWTESITSAAATWSEKVISPVTSWAEVLEQFRLWNDGNSFWQDVNAKYEDL